MIGKGGAAHSKQSPIASGVHVNSAIYGKAIRPVLGRSRVGVDMIFTGNFQVHQSDGKKGKSGKKGQNMTTYSAAFDFLVGYGPVISTGAVYANKDSFWNAFVGSQQFVLSGTGKDWSGNIVPSGPLLNIFAITIRQNVNVTFNDYGSLGPVTISGFFNKPLYNSNGHPLIVLQPGQGQDYCTYAIGNSADTSWSVHVDTPITNPVINVYYLYETPGAQPFTLQSEGGSGLMLETELGNGTEFNYPGGSSFQKIYPEFFGFGAPYIDLGAGDMCPNYSSEVVCWGNLSPTGDASPADFLLAMVTAGNFWPLNPTSSCWAWGLGFNPGASELDARPNILADPPSPAPGQTTSLTGLYSRGLEAVRDYCDAYGIYISGSIEDQRTAADYIDEFSDIANCAVVWNGQKLNFIPRCEVSAVGNGAVYTAPTASGPIFAIDDTVLITTGKGEDPVTVIRNEKQDPRAIANVLPIQHKSRASGFYTDIITTYRDEVRITQYGTVQDSSKNWPWIQDAPTALKAAAPVMRRKAMVETVNIKFKLPVTHFLLDPWDLVTVRERAFMWDSTFALYQPGGDSVPLVNQGVDKPVRITSMEEDENRIISVESEPFIYGAHAPSNQTPATATPSTPTTGGTPASINTPIIFEPVPKLSGGVEQIWIAASDTDTIYGGCSVYLSTDGGNNYQLIGTLVGNSVMGAVYNGTYPSSPDPDATDTLYVDLTESDGALATFSTTDRDNFVPLCYLAPGGSTTLNGKTATVPYELISYATVTLQTGNKYSLSPTIRRGVFSTPDVAHAVGQAFAYLGPGANLFKYTLPTNLIGQTLYFKFAAFDLYGKNSQSLSACTAYSFTPTGLGVTATTSSYTLSPSVVLYQGKTGGWPGVATGSSSWTDPTKVYIPPFTVTWSDGTVVNYAPTSPVAITGTPPETLYGAIYDPGRTGSGTFYLDTTDRSALAGYISLGSIVIQNTSTGGSSGGSSAGTPYDIYAFFNGAPTASFAMLRLVADRAITLPQNLTGSKAVCVTAPTGAVTLTILRNGTTIGTVNFAAGATTGTFTFTNAVTLAVGDVLELDAPSTPDGTFASPSITLMATR